MMHKRDVRKVPCCNLIVVQIGVAKRGQEDKRIIFKCVIYGSIRVVEASSITIILLLLTLLVGPNALSFGVTLRKGILCSCIVRESKSK